MTTGVTLGVQLGRFHIAPPLRVDLHRYPDGKWAALLEPGEVTGAEYGYGKTAEEALRDLETTIAEMMAFFAKTPEEKLGEGLLAYKRALAECVSVNTTIGVVDDA